MRVALVNIYGHSNGKPVRTAATLRRHAPKSLLMRYVWWNVLLSRRWPRTPKPEFERLVFVCLGNVCRSPYAEARARQAGMKALSFGLAVDENVSPPGTAVEVASSRGIDLSMHRSRSINELEPAPNDFVLVMEPPMLGPTRDRLRHGANVALLGLCGRSGPTIPYIPDPLGLSEPVFSAVYDIIDHCVQGLAAER